MACRCLCRGRGQAPPRPADADPDPTPVHARADALGLPTLTPERLRAAEAITAVAGLAPDIVVLADYGQIVPPAVLGLPAHGALNLHPSLLPRHRGASPIPAAILAGDAETGVSLMVMDAGLDTGPIVAQAGLALDGTETAPGLEQVLAVMAADLLAACLEPWLEGRLPATPQSDDGVTLTRPLRRDDGRLDPTLPAARVERMVRAYQPWPGTWFESAVGRIVVWSAEPAAAHPGRPDAADDRVRVIGRLDADGDGLPSRSPTAASACSRSRPPALAG
jgi:methionyl-tRNA formyltransferase